MRKEQKRVINKKRIEEIAKEGYIELRWLPSSKCIKKTRETFYSYDFEKIGWVLYGKPIDYGGPYEDYEEPIFAQVVMKKRIRGYRKVTSTSFGLFAHEWVWDKTQIK